MQLGFRGMQRYKSDLPMWDFVSVHAAVRTWMHGGDPYNVEAVTATWKSANIFSDRDVSYFATVYPPTSLVTMVPLAILPAPYAMTVWMGIMLLLIALQFAALADLAKLNWKSPEFMLLVGGALASAAMQFGILSGQLSLPAISLCILAFWCANRNRQILGGALLGLACAIKPQLAGPFVVYYIVLKQFRLVAAAAVVGGIIGVVALGAMHFTEINWMQGWKASIARTQQIGEVNDYGWAGTFRDEIIDLKMLVVSIGLSKTALSGLIGLIVLGLCIVYVAVFPFKTARRDDATLLTLAGFSALILLPIYHRVYDATILALALAWAVSNLDGPRRRHAWMMIIPLLVFLVPFDIVKSVASRRPHLYDIAHSWWWQSFIAPHYAWGLLGVTLVILYVLKREKVAAAALPVE